MPFNLGTADSVVSIFFWVLSVAAFAVEIWAFSDVLRRPQNAFPAVGKQTKKLWLIILGVALLIGLAGAIGYISLISVFPVVAFVAAAIYLADVRPKVREIRNPQSGARQGPYGPW
jgi:hypothetical protein